MKLYKIRRKVDITPCLDLSVWAVIPKEPSEEGSQKLKQHASKAVVITPDPRVDVMGWRLIINKGVSPLDVVPGSQIGDVQDYHRHRYKQGKTAQLWKIVPVAIGREGENSAPLSLDTFSYSFIVQYSLGGLILFLWCYLSVHCSCSYKSSPASSVVCWRPESQYRS